MKKKKNILINQLGGEHFIFVVLVVVRAARLLVDGVGLEQWDGGLHLPPLLTGDPPTEPE